MLYMAQQMVRLQLGAWTLMRLDAFRSRTLLFDLNIFCGPIPAHSPSPQPMASNA